MRAGGSCAAATMGMAMGIGRLRAVGGRHDSIELLLCYLVIRATQTQVLASLCRCAVSSYAHDDGPSDPGEPLQSASRERPRAPVSAGLGSPAAIATDRPS